MGRLKFTFKRAPRPACGVCQRKDVFLLRWEDFDLPAGDPARVMWRCTRHMPAGADFSVFATAARG